MSLWDHQAAVQPDLVMGNYALWWEPGVGKTDAFASAAAEVGGPMLYIADPGPLMQTARKVLPYFKDNFLGSGMEIVRKTVDKIDPRADIVFVPYTMVRRPPIWRQLFKRRWGSLILDEAHNLANPMGVTAAAVYGNKYDSKGALIRKADYVWPGTGTPILSYPQTLYNHFSRLWPRETIEACGGLTYTQWENYFCKKIEGEYGMKIVGAQHEDVLRDLIAATGSVLAMDTVHKNIPEALPSDLIPLEGDKIDLSDLPQEEQDDINFAIGRIDRLPEGADLSEFAVCTATLRKRLSQAKARPLVDVIKAELAGGRDRILVFGGHPEPLQYIAGQLEGKAGAIVGATPKSERERMIAAYQSGHLPVLCGHWQSLGVGWDLQQGARVIFLDTPFEPINLKQPIGRIYRGGQTRPCYTSFAYLLDSPDGRFARIVRPKVAHIKRVLT